MEICRSKCDIVCKIVLSYFSSLAIGFVFLRITIFFLYPFDYGSDSKLPLPEKAIRNLTRVL